MASGALTALIADDDEFFRMALSSLLAKQFGFSSVVEAASLDEALDRLSDGVAYRIALFDLQMPGIHSPANLRAVRECFPDLLVAIVSASSDRRNMLLALEAGVHGYIPKGLGIGLLTLALQTVLSGGIYVPASITQLSPDDDTAPTGETSNSHRVIGLETLTRRQREVLELLVGGRSNKEISRTLALSEGTVKVHMAALFRTLGVNSRSAAAAAGARIFSAR